MNTSGIYIGFSDNSYIFTDGTTVDSDWLPTERDWYKEGINYDTLTATEPYLDVSTGYMCVTFCRKIDLANGENGVLAIDIYLDVLSDTIDELKPMGTGASFAIADNMVLAYPENKDLNGKDVSEGGDFTVEMPARTGDEIGLIRDELRSYVANMKSTISDIQKNAAKLHEDSASSKEASAAMSD